MSLLFPRGDTSCLRRLPWWWCFLPLNSRPPEVYPPHSPCPVEEACYLCKLTPARKSHEISEGVWPTQEMGMYPILFSVSAVEGRTMKLGIFLLKGKWLIKMQIRKEEMAV